MNYTKNSFELSSKVGGSKQSFKNLEHFVPIVDEKELEMNNHILPTNFSGETSDADTYNTPAVLIDLTKNNWEEDIPIAEREYFQDFYSTFAPVKSLKRSSSTNMDGTSTPLSIDKLNGELAFEELDDNPKSSLKNVAQSSVISKNLDHDQEKINTSVSSTKPKIVASTILSQKIVVVPSTHGNNHKLPLQYSTDATGDNKMVISDPLPSNISENLRKSLGWPTKAVLTKQKKRIAKPKDKKPFVLTGDDWIEREEANLAEKKNKTEEVERKKRIRLEKAEQAKIIKEEKEKLRLKKQEERMQKEKEKIEKNKQKIAEKQKKIEEKEAKEKEREEVLAKKRKLIEKKECLEE